MESTLGYVHWWPQINHPGHEVYLPRRPEVVRELLPEKVIEEIREEVKRMTSNLKHTYRPQRTHENDVIQLNDGVYEVYAPVEDAPQIELIFIHGILEDEAEEQPYLTTWSTGKSRDECWIHTWLVSQTSVDLSRARVLTVTYDVSVWKTGSKGNMDNFVVAENLFLSLIKLAGVGQNSCPVVMVGHSLGGLVIKEVCIQAIDRINLQEDASSRKSGNFVTNLKGIFFYSTPHLGINSSVLDPDHSTGEGSASNHLQRPQLAELMSTLELCNKLSARNNDKFDKLCRTHKWKVVGIGENNKTKIRAMKDLESVVTEIVVTEASARSGCFHGFCTIPNSDHFTICRPKNPRSTNFLLLVDFIRDLMHEG